MPIKQQLSIFKLSVLCSGGAGSAIPQFCIIHLQFLFFVAILDCYEREEDEMLPVVSFTFNWTHPEYAALLDCKRRFGWRKNINPACCCCMREREREREREKSFFLFFYFLSNGVRIKWSKSTSAIRFTFSTCQTPMHSKGVNWARLNGAKMHSFKWHIHCYFLKTPPLMYLMHLWHF